MLFISYARDKDLEFVSGIVVTSEDDSEMEMGID